MVRSEGRRRVVVLGEKRVAELCLDFLQRSPGTEIVAVVTSEKDWQADLRRWAEDRRIMALVGNAQNHIGTLVALRPDFVFSFQYRFLVRENLLKLPSEGTYNLHFGLLPRYGGCYPVAWAIRNGEREAGVTLHHMSARFDEGDIVAQRAVPIKEGCTARELFDELTLGGVQLFSETYPRLLAGLGKRVPQDASKRLYYTMDSIDFDRDRYVDWHRPAAVVDREIRAFTFEPFQLAGSRVRFPDGSVGLVTIERGPAPPGSPRAGVRPPGSSQGLDERGFLLVAAGDGGLVALQRIGGIAAPEFVRQHGGDPMAIQFLLADGP